MNNSHFYLFVLLVNCYGFPDDKLIVRARIESCTGCSLAKYPEVKKFIESDIPDFEDVVFKEVPGLSPELVFFNKYDKELERHPLRCNYHEECSELLLEKGFKRKVKVAKLFDMRAKKGLELKQANYTIFKCMSKRHKMNFRIY